MTKILKKTHKQIAVYLFFGAMGHHALAGGSTSLSHSAMEEELWLNGECEWKRGGCGWLERQRGLKESMGSITVCKRSVLRVTPHPPFIDFFWGFRVLSPWSRI